MGLVVRVGWLKLGDLYCGKLGPSWAFEVYEFVLDDKDK